MVRKDLKRKTFFWLSMFILLVVVAQLTPSAWRVWFILPSLVVFFAFLVQWGEQIDEWKQTL